jgi:hypothetical protein
MRQGEITDVNPDESAGVGNLSLVLACNQVAHALVGGVQGGE